jgi:hypothetical protein
MNSLGPRCAVLIAHPGHELVIHELVARSHPLVAVLTDGSGNTGQSRIDSTSRVLEAAHAEPAPFYGGYTDGQCYAALLARDSDLFIGMAEEVAELLVASRIEMVVGDASEGWNPIHDIWRSVVNTAVALASGRLGRDLRNFEFALFGSHAAAAATSSAESIVLRLDEAAFDRKMAISTAYDELHAEVAAAMKGSTSALVGPGPLSAELDRRLGGLNGDSYRVELLRPVDAHATLAPDAPRVYEMYGEMMVAAGKYREAIRHDRHLAPVEAALRQHALRHTGSRLCASSSTATT